MEQYILAHDIGTSSDKAVLVRFDGTIRATCTAPYPTHYPEPAWVEQNPKDYWAAVCETSSRITKENDIDPKNVKGIVFSTQAQGIIPVDEKGT
ncbi:MAG: FGGY family carbohydrate kinase, partial [Oscillospiraceae bacterium]